MTPESLAALAERRGTDAPDAPFLLEARGPRVVTFGALAADLAGDRSWLAGEGLVPGARVGLVVADPLDFCRWLLAGLSAGLWVAPLDPTPAPGAAATTSERIRTLALDAVLADRPRPEGLSVPWLEVDAAYSGTALEAPGAVGGILLASSGTTGTPKVMALPVAQVLSTAALVAAHHGLGPGERGFNPLPLWHVNAEVVGVLAALVAGARAGSALEAPGAVGGILLASSGTTGTPKVMALPVAQVLATAGLVAEHHGLGPGERGFNPLPLWHVNAEVVGVLAALVSGASLALDDRFHRTGFWKVVDGAGATWVNAVPAIIARLIQPEAGERVPERVRFVRSASAPLAPSLEETFERATGVPVVQSYGMTEAASQICVNPVDGPRKAGSVGRPVGVSLRVVSVEGRTVLGAGTVGSIEIGGPTVIDHYEWGAYADRFDDEGWLRTGDLGYVDEDGYVFLVGRSDDVINRGGEKVYPLEIEHVLAAVEGVAAVAVVGESDEVFGQVPVAFVQPRDADDLGGERAVALVARLREAAGVALARPTRPARIKLVEAFSAHATGKIQKNRLRDGTVPVAYVEAV